MIDQMVFTPPCIKLRVTCTNDGPNGSKLSIWILEDYGTNIWTLKHTVSILKVFKKTNIEFGYLDVDESYSGVTIHPEWNLLLFVGVGEGKSHRRI